MSRIILALALASSASAQAAFDRSSAVKSATASAAFSLADYAKDPAKYKGLLDESSQGRRQLTGACAGTYGTTCPVGYVFEENNVVATYNGYGISAHQEGPNSWMRLTGDWHLTYGMPDKSIDSCGKICDTDQGDAANCGAIEYNESPNCGSGDACSSGASQDCYLLKSTLTLANQVAFASTTTGTFQSVLYAPNPQSPGTIACIKDSCTTNCISAAAAWAPAFYQCACSCPVVSAPTSVPLPAPTSLPLPAPTPSAPLPAATSSTNATYTEMTTCGENGDETLHKYDDRAGCCEDMNEDDLDAFIGSLNAADPAVAAACAYHSF